MVRGIDMWEKCSWQSKYQERYFSRKLALAFTLYNIIHPSHYDPEQDEAWISISTNGQRINHLLYMDDLKWYSSTEKELNSLVETVRVFSKDMNMEFGIQKCAMLILKRGKSVKTEGIQLQNNKYIRSLEYAENYTYLGVLQTNDIKCSEMRK